MAQKPKPFEGKVENLNKWVIAHESSPFCSLWMLGSPPPPHCLVSIPRLWCQSESQHHKTGEIKTRPVRLHRRELLQNSVREQLFLKPSVSLARLYIEQKRTSNLNSHVMHLFPFQAVISFPFQVGSLFLENRRPTPTPFSWDSKEMLISTCTFHETRSDLSQTTGSPPGSKE